MEEREYFEAVERFLAYIHPKKVKSMCMVALLDDPDDRDVLMAFDAAPSDLAMMSGIVNMHAAYDYMHINADDDGEEGE